MATAASKLPTEDRPMRIDPDLAEAIEQELKPYEGAELRKAQAAIQKVRAAAHEGSFSTILERYRAAIAEAVGA